MSEWVETTLGEVATWSGGLTPSKSNDAYWNNGVVPWLSSKEVVGGVLLATEHRITQAALEQTSLRLVPPNSVAVVVRSGILLHTFPVALVPFPCTVNQDVKIAVAGPETTGQFLRLLLEHSAPAILDRLRKTGTTVQSIDVPGLLRFPVTLPPLPEQRRIVDVIFAVDAQTKALVAEVDRGRAAVGPLAQAMLSADESWPVTRLGDVGEFARGKRFTKADYTESGLGVIHYAHIHTHFGPIATDVVARVSEDARAWLRLASPGDVVIAATSEDLAGVGKATVWLGAEDVAVHDDCQIFRHDLDPRFATFIFASPAFQDQKVQYAGGTKVTRISSGDLAKITAPIPPMDIQKRIGLALAEAVDQADRVEHELAQLRTFRSILLALLLNQEVEIPESYDAILERSA